MSNHPRPDLNLQLVMVFRTNDPGLAGIVESILKGAAIDYATSGGTMKGGRLTEFRVRQSDAKAAALLLLNLPSSG
jgi:hypothetical protein